MARLQPGRVLEGEGNVGDRRPVGHGSPSSAFPDASLRRRLGLRPLSGRTNGASRSSAQAIHGNRHVGLTTTRAQGRSRSRSRRPRAASRAGGLVAFPTETVYGLGADATNGAAVARLYAAKGRPRFNPLIAHVLDARPRAALARFDAARRRLAAAFWPGPLTLVLPKADGLPGRGPRHRRARHDRGARAGPPGRARPAGGFGKPIVAPSANRSGHVSPTTAQHVLADLAGSIDLILDGGPTPSGSSPRSSPASATPALLRPGGIAARGDRAACSALPLARPRALRRQAKTRRSRPAARLALCAAGAAAPRRDARSVRAKRCSPSARRCRPSAATRPQPLALGRSRRGRGEPLLAPARARCLTARRAIAVMPIPDEGLGEAINDRLGRAAAPGRHTADHLEPPARPNCAHEHPRQTH